MQRRLQQGEDPSLCSFESLRTSMLYSSDKELKSVLVSSAGRRGQDYDIVNLTYLFKSW